MKFPESEAWQVFFSGDFWKAHEIWEAEWRRADDPRRLILKCLIQTAALGLKLKSPHRSAAERLRLRILELASLSKPSDWLKVGIPRDLFCQSIQVWSGSPEELLRLLSSETHEEK